MACYAIGDIHGCFKTFTVLLAQCRFDPGLDRLWLVGDLVNGGPDSLQTLRWVRSLGETAVTVLGNHDIYLLARACGACPRKKRDTLDEILAAPDCDELLNWLRQRPLIHREDGRLLVHAGLLPDWTLEEASDLAQEISEKLSSGAAAFLAELYSQKRERWDRHRSGDGRLFCALQAMTLLRTCRRDSRMCLDFSGPPDQAPKGCRPWYSWPASKARGLTVYFGHWAALGFKETKTAVGLDSGCVWGKSLTAVRLEDGQVFEQKSLEGE